MAQTLQDIRNAMKDYVGNYSTGSLRDDVTDRFINRAIERLKRQIAIPADEVIYSFWYTQDKLFYDLPASFREALYVQYNTKNINTLANKWEYFDYPTVLQTVGSSPANRWSFTHINGKKQLVMAGLNRQLGRTIVSFDTLTNISVADDASGLTLDSIIKLNSTASVSFDITDSTGVATVAITNLSLDLEELFERQGFLKVYSWMTAGNIDDVTIKLISSTGNYYSIVATQNDDGVDFTQDEWQKIAWHTNDKVTVGTPVLSAITDIEIEFGLGTGFTSATEFRLDTLFTVFGEKMDLVHFSNKKGTTSAGVEKPNLTLPDDIPWYSGNYDDYTDLIAQQAALMAWPQLRGDKEQYMLLRADFKENLMTYTKSFPRKRVQGQFRHRLAR